jgi:nitrate reductase gamma subunit
VIEWMSALLVNFGLMGLPYASLAIAVVGVVHRFRNHGSSLSTSSTQFLENDRHFWSVVPFHYGILVVLAIHLVCWGLPWIVLWWTASGLRLILLEIVAVTAGVTALVGLVVGVHRRWTVSVLGPVTGAVDWLVLAVVGVQVVTGLLIAVAHPWGTPWLAAAGAPYLRSILLLDPDVGSVANAPLLIQLHIVNGFVLVGLIPYTKLSHMLVLPLAYLRRAPLTFRWRERRKERPGGVA